MPKNETAKYGETGLFQDTFDLLISPSNMPKNETAKYGDTGLFQDTFDKSVKMSTYLVAFMVMDFTSRSATTSTGKTVKLL